MEVALAALTARLQRFAESGARSLALDPAALDEAGRLHAAARRAGAGPHAIRVDALMLLMSLHLARYQALPAGQGQDDLQGALAFFDVLMDRAPEQVPEQVRRVLAKMRSVGDADRFGAEGLRIYGEWQQTGRPELLDRAERAFRAGKAAAPPGHPVRAACLTCLGFALRARFEQTGDLADADAAVDASRGAVTGTAPGHPEYPKYLTNLGAALARRFESAGDTADLDEAVDAGQQAIAAAPAGHPDRAGMLSNLGFWLRIRFDQTGHTRDLDAAVNAAREAVSPAEPGSPNRAMHLSNLVGTLVRRFEYAGQAEDLDAAIETGHQALALTPPGHPNRAIYLSNLGNGLRVRFENAGDATDLDASIEAARETVSATAPGHPNRAAYLSNLGNALFRRFEHAGDAADLDASIEAARETVSATAPGHPNRAMYLSNLGMALRSRFEHTRDTADLDAAVSNGHEAIAATPPGHPSRAAYLSNLGNALVRRFDHAGDAADLDVAVEAGRQASAATAPGHPSRAMYLSNLGMALVVRFEHTGEAADLDAAMDAGQQALAVTPPGHPTRMTHLHNLARRLFARFEHTGDPADLDAAIDVGQQAVQATPPGHPDRARILHALGFRLYARFGRNGDSADSGAALASWQQASHMPTAAPGLRLLAASAWAARLASAGRTHEAVEGYATAVELLPQVAWHGLARTTRAEQLAVWAGLATDAAACAVKAGHPEQAVELLEQGRSVLWAQALNLRTDLTRLASAHPRLAGRLDGIRTLLDSPVLDEMAMMPEPAGDGTSARDRARSTRETVELRRRKAREWDEVLAQVRMLKGFEHFLAATPYPELAATTAAGPTVILNASGHGCHALIVHPGSDRASAVDLPGMSLPAARDRADMMLAALAGATDPGRGLRDREKDRHVILDVLDWLWDVLAEPVLAALGFSTAPGPDDSWPRVYWCPTGPLTVLPIHAAGHHPRHRSAAGADCVLDRAVSSYTPTLAALTRTRRPLTPVPARHLTVGMPTTPGLPPLPAVRAEMEVLARHFPPHPGNCQLTGPEATLDAVRAAIATSSRVHLACHAGKLPADPDRSGFALWDATLTITDLAALPSQHRDLAFLSACQTAAGSVRHLDEAIHPAAAMQFLGYRHVIATMWSIADSAAPHVADSIYTTLAQCGRPGPDRTAEALHLAIRSLRQTDPANPLLWAPYIHLGT